MFSSRFLPPAFVSECHVPERRFREFGKER
jgi:hypothetical protein